MIYGYGPLVTRAFVSQGASYARGTSIDPYLTEEDMNAVYMLWKATWPAPLAFQGGQKDITFELIRQVPEEEFMKVLGKKRAERIYAAASQISV